MKRYFPHLFLAGIFILLSLLLGYVQARADSSSTPNATLGSGIQAEGSTLSSRVAPGESLPFLVKLMNFGSTRRVDVTISYSIKNAAGGEVYSQKETVAVDTTASFVKQIPLPSSVPAGTYTLTTTIVYDYQQVPAISSFNFIVEPKIWGFFRSDFILYACITLLVSLLAIILMHYFLNHRSRGRIMSYSYDDKPKDQRVYYEIVSDAIAQMRLRKGDDALEIASHIPDLSIDPNTGRVLDMRSNPSKILALLVLRYETLLGRSVELSPRGGWAKEGAELAPIEESVNVVRTYFE